MLGDSVVLTALGQVRVPCGFNSVTVVESADAPSSCCTYLVTQCLLTLTQHVPCSADCIHANLSACGQIMPGGAPASRLIAVVLRC